jgi:hypothetical protein
MVPFGRQKLLIIWMPHSLSSGSFPSFPDMMLQEAVAQQSQIITTKQFSRPPRQAWIAAGQYC